MPTQQEPAPEMTLWVANCSMDYVFKNNSPSGGMFAIVEAIIFAMSGVIFMPANECVDRTCKHLFEPYTKCREEPCGCMQEDDCGEHQQGGTK